MRTIKTAVLMAAGNGTRRLPITRVIDKPMLPIGNRPTIDYVVEQCVRAGIEHIVCVISSDDSLIRKYYGDRIDIAAEYPWLGKEGELSVVYVVQNMEKYGYGSGSALACVEDIVKDEVFAVVAADGFIYNPDESTVEVMVRGFSEDPSCVGAITGLKLPDSEIGLYSLVTHTDDYHLEQLIEKPTIEPKGKIVLGNLSYYVLPQSVFPVLRDLEQHNGEYYLTDAVQEIAKTDGIKVVPVSGEYLDSGQVKKWIEANRHIVDI